MARKNQPWYRSERDQWYVNINGKQTPLGVMGEGSEAQAHAAWQLLLQAAQQLQGLTVPSTVATPPPRTVRQAVEEYVDRRCLRISEHSVRSLRWRARQFLEGIGPAADRPLTELTVEQVEDSAERPTWSASTRNTYLGEVMTILKGVGHPLKVKRPPKESRGADSVLTDDQFQQVIGAAQAEFRPYLRVLRETGARPGEVSGLTVESIDWPNSCARLKHHKTRRHGCIRIIYFTATAMEVLHGQRQRHGSGLLFRRPDGEALDMYSIVRRMQTISRRVGFPVTAYGLGRHSFATRALIAGVPDAVVAELLGHRGTAMVHKHYSHLTQQSQVLRAAAEQVGRHRA